MRAVRGLLLTTALVAASAAHDVATAGDAPRAIDVIENDLVADDPAVRAKAAAELADRFPDGAVAVPMLVDLLDDESPDVVAAAAKAIDSMAVAGAGPLAKWCADDAHLDPNTRFGESMPVLLSLKAPTSADAIDLDEVAAAKVPPDVPVMTALLPDRQWSASSIPLLLTIWRSHSGATRGTAGAAMALRATDSVAARGIAPTATPARSADVDAAVALVKSDLDMRSWMGSRLLARLRATDASVVAALANAM